MYNKYRFFLSFSFLFPYLLCTANITFLLRRNHMTTHCTQNVQYNQNMNEMPITSVLFTKKYIYIRRERKIENKILFLCLYLYLLTY